MQSPASPWHTAGLGALDQTARTALAVRTSTKRPGQRLLSRPDLRLNQRLQNWAWSFLKDVEVGTGWLLQHRERKPLSKINRGCGWQVSDQVPVKKKKVGISGNLEPKCYKWLTGGSLILTSSPISGWENATPILTESVRREVSVWKMWRNRETHTAEDSAATKYSACPSKGLIIVHKKLTDN